MTWRNEKGPPGRGHADTVPLCLLQPADGDRAPQGGDGGALPDLLGSGGRADARLRRRRRGAIYAPPGPAPGIVLTPAKATVLAVFVVVLIGIAFFAGMLVGRS